MQLVDKEFLIALVGKKIRFTKAIDDWEMYAEEGMYAIVTKWYFDDSHEEPVHRVWVDFSDFETENHRRQNANYYDNKGKPTLTAVEAGYYKPIDDIYIDKLVSQIPFEIVKE